MSIAINRHHKRRLKENRKHHWSGNGNRGMLIKTPTPCSCWMCGNERKYFKKRTLDEIRHIHVFKQEMNQI